MDLESSFLNDYSLFNFKTELEEIGLKSKGDAFKLKESRGDVRKSKEALKSTID